MPLKTEKGGTQEFIESFMGSSNIQLGPPAVECDRLADIQSPHRKNSMARLKSFSPDKIAQSRKLEGINQSEFWRRFGVTQSGGSRYESGRNIPVPTAMLMWLRESGKVSDKDLAGALKAVKSAGS